MQFHSKATISNNIDFDFLPLAREAYQLGTANEAATIAYDTSAMIKDFKQTVSAYKSKFETDYMTYLQQNNVLRKMKKSLTGTRNKETIAITLKEVQNNKKATLNFINTMNLGHSLLLQMRQTLTGQEIRTKFMIEHEGKIYQVYEDQLPPDAIQLSLSRFGAGTVSNPVSLAYQLDVEVLKAANVLKDENLIDNTTSLNLYQTILGLKPEYLKRKSIETGRKYPHIFWDSKDMELIEQLQQEAAENGMISIDVERYAALRRSLGGGGGYASAFYKIGDIGSTQIKFFKFKNNAKIANVNFARFSLLRDRFAQLESILNNDTQTAVMQGLESFFTEKEEFISDKMSKVFNEEAKSAFKQWLVNS